MRTALIIILLLGAKLSFGQDKHEAVINWKYQGIVEVFDRPEGKVKLQLKHDSINENFLSLTILKHSNQYFFVTIGLTMDTNMVTGWIKKADYIGAYSKHENFPMDLVLYKKKKASESNKIIIKDWAPELLTFEDCKNDWILVSAKHNGLLIKGWIEKERLCANSYTYCN